MAEAEVSYASVVFTNNKQRSHKAKQQETVYDEVRERRKTTEETAETKVSAGFSPEEKSNSRHRVHQWLACCLGILCVILLSALIAVSVFLALKRESDVSELNKLKDHQTTLTAVNHNLTNLNNNLTNLNNNLTNLNNNLTNLNNNLTNLNNNLTNLNNNLTVMIGSLTQTRTILETTIKNQSEGIQKLESQNKQLETIRNNLTEQLQTLENNSNELNFTRAQWSINNYCPKDKGRQCNYCQNGWAIGPSNSSCYAINNAQPSDQKTWEEAQENCTGKNSDLAVIVNEEEKTFTTQKSWSNPKINGYWIGLRGENGRWKWVDGSFLNQSSWIQQSPTDGSCVTSLQNRGWKSVNCSEKNAWICKKKALSV